MAEANTKPTIMEIAPELWKSAKIQAINEDISLKDFVARAIRNELERVGFPTKNTAL